MKRQAVILGSGKIGGAVARLLARTGDYRVWVADKDTSALARLPTHPDIATETLDVADEAALSAFLKGKERVLSACPYYINPGIARAALSAGVSYFDLTEDRATTEAVMETANAPRDGQIFMPQCGLAPGFISILAHDLCRGYDELETVKMRVGALPMYPSNMMLYNLTWSTDGLINEYCNPCEAIVERQRTEVLALEGLENFSLDGHNYEAFNTSGGLGTLCDTLDGKVRALNYKTVRYRGHQYLMRFLVNELRLKHDRATMKHLLENAVPITMQDVTLTFCTVSGWIDGQFIQRSDARKIYNRAIDGETWSSIQITTAAGICAVVDLQADGLLPRSGFVRQEQVPLDAFLANRFGAFYRTAPDEHHDAQIQNSDN
jgi:saccharopine dehydrogenase-like NADP-dependent oxidoreductase